MEGGVSLGHSGMSAGLRLPAAVRDRPARLLLPRRPRQLSGSVVVDPVFCAQSAPGQSESRWLSVPAGAKWHRGVDRSLVATLAPMSAAYEISPGSAADIPALKAAFLSLHEQHRELSAVALTEPDGRAWAERIRTYKQYFTADQALLYLARIGGRCVGYAFTVLHPGCDDTFPLGAGYAELYTLAVLPESRGLGIGTALLDVVDAALADAAIPNLTVAVMAQNDAAIRLYRHRGLVPGELIMYRIGGEMASASNS